jgi:recombination protein RecA
MTRKDDQVEDLFSRVEKALAKKELDISGYRASDVRIASHIPYGIRTRMPQLDLAMGRPGYPVGRVIELYGLPYCGKTTAGFLAIAETQKQGGLAILIDTETAFEPMRAAEVGVDVDNLRIYSPISIQETFTLIGEILDALVDFSKPIVIVVDSVTAVPTKWQGEKGLTNQKPGELAQQIKMGMKIITSKVAKKKALLLLVNHAHETMAMYGKKTTSSGGHAIKFFSSNRIEFKHTKTLKTADGKERLGQEIKVNIEKLKVAKLRHPDFKINLMVDGGFDTLGSLLEAMISIGMVKHPKGGKVYTLETGTEFAKIEWPQVVADNGGLDALYEHFIKEACARGRMIPWGSQENG